MPLGSRAYAEISASSSFWTNQPRCFVRAEGGRFPTLSTALYFNTLGSRACAVGVRKKQRFESLRWGPLQKRFCLQVSAIHCYQIPAADELMFVG